MAPRARKQETVIKVPSHVASYRQSMSGSRPSKVADVETIDEDRLWSELSQLEHDMYDGEDEPEETVQEPRKTVSWIKKGYTRSPAPKKLRRTRLQKSEETIAARPKGLKKPASWKTAEEAPEKPANRVLRKPASLRTGESVQAVSEAPVEQETRYLSSPDKPCHVADEIMPDLENTGPVKHWRGDWYRWNGSNYAVIDEDELSGDIYEATRSAVYRYTDGRSGITKERDWSPTRSKVADLKDVIRSRNKVPSSVEPGTWLDGKNRGKAIAFQNGLLDMDTMKVRKSSPDFFGTSSIPFDYDPDDTAITEWYLFLKSVWGGDQESIDTLQEMFGYVLSGDRSLHKMFVVVGPTRSGKGTIDKVLQQLVGRENCCGPTLRSMSTNFGLSPLVGKQVAVVSDARMPRNTEGVMENLLLISGQDSMDIDRKYRDPWHGVLGSQLFIYSNEIPSFADSSNAISGRVVMLRMKKSFLGREDTSLGARLSRELPGILNWALEGLKRLQARGEFHQPSSAKDSIEIMRESTSPMSRFLSEDCLLGEGQSVSCDVLYEEYREWCDRNHRDKPVMKESFGRQLLSAAPDVHRVRVRSKKFSGHVYSGVSLKK